MHVNLGSILRASAKMLVRGLLPEPSADDMKAHLGLACTGSKDNPGALGDVKRSAEELGVDDVSSVVHSSELYFGEQEDMVPRDARTRKDLVEIATKQLRSSRPKDWTHPSWPLSRRRAPTATGCDPIATPWG